MKRRAGIDAKIERAEKHIQDLEIWLCGFGETKPYILGTKPHKVPDLGWTTIYIKDVNEFGASLFVGDCIHNLRSALDHLAWQLVEAGGGVPNKDTSFPISDTSHQYASAIGKGEINKIACKAKEVLSGVQPFKTGDNTLSVLHTLDIFDKHRVLLTAMMAVADYGIHFGANQMLWFNSDRRLPLMRGNEVVNIPTRTIADMKGDFKLAVEITFIEPEVVKGKPVLETLKQMADAVLMIVDRFGPFLI